MNEQLIKTVKELFKEKSLNPNSICHVLKENLDIKKQLEDIFNSNKDKYCSLGKLVISIVNDIKFTYCQVCGKQLNYDKSINGSKYCSNKCKLSKEGNPFNRVKDKIKKINLQKYGTENPSRSNQIKEKIKNTNIKKYGVENVFASKEIKQKIKNTNLIRYGRIYDNEEIKNKILKTHYLTTYNKIVQKYKGIYEPLFGQNQYVGCGKEYRWKCCKCGSILNMRYDNGLIQSRCFNCYPRKQINKSQYEEQIADFIRGYGFDILLNDRTLIKPKELDIIVPSKKLAIQFNGTYWHSDQVLLDTNYHMKKSDECEDKGYQLIHIFEHDWKDSTKKEIIKDIIKSKLGVLSSKIYAKDCYLVCGKDEDFLVKNCLNPKSDYDLSLGLEYKNRLVFLMTFKNNEIVNSCSLLDTIVVGGISKVLKHFSSNANGIIDRTYFSGIGYKRLGFCIKQRINPDRILVNNMILHNAGYFKVIR